MKNKGFTLIEIIGAIILISIIAVIAFTTYTGSMRGFRDDYYTDLTRTLEQSGKEFFNDNRKYRPNGILEAQKISVNGLVSEKYLNEIVDYNGDSCNLSSSYVLIVKEGKDDYSYHTCLICEKDEYSSLEDKYCDSSWLDPSKVTYGLGADLGTIYIYKGTDRDELKDMLELSISYVRKNYANEVIATVNGDGTDDLPTVFPVDMDVVDTNKVGTYKVKYEYSPPKSIEGGAVVKDTGERTVVVYENDAPGITYTYENKVSNATFTVGSLGVTNKTGSGSIDTKTGTYESGTWAQEITVKINGSGINIPDSNVVISRYQWYKDKRWQDFCVTDRDCTVKLSQDMNEEVRFRMIDSAGHIGQETAPITIRRDNTPPTCELQLDGTLGQRSGASTGWYVTDVGITFKKNEEVLATYEGAKSGIVVSNISVSTANVNRGISNYSKTQDVDVSTITYVGYTEDRAGNFATCSKTFKRDATKPVCTFTLDGTKGKIGGTETGWYVSNVGVTIHDSDNLSGVHSFGIDNDRTKHSITHDTQGASLSHSGIIEDNAGNTNTCVTPTFKMDKTAPVCELQMPAINGENGWYKSSSVTSSFKSYTDNLSGVQSYGFGSYTGSHTYTQTANGTGLQHTGYIRDNAGNTSSCKTAVYRKDDASGVTCFARGNSTWTNNSSINVSRGAVTSPISGCQGYSGTGFVLGANCTINVLHSVNAGSYEQTHNYEALSFTTMSGATFNCPAVTIDIYIDRTSPTCTTAKSNTYTTAGVTTAVTCSDTGSGCNTSGSDTGGSSLKTGTYSYTVYDSAGNSGTCSATVNQTTQYIEYTRDDATCTSSSCCGTKDCNCKWAYGNWSSWGSMTQSCVPLSDQPDPGMGYTDTDSEEWTCGVREENYCCRSRTRSKEWKCDQCAKECTSSCCGYTSWTVLYDWSTTVRNCSSTYCSSGSRIVYY